MNAINRDISINPVYYDYINATQRLQVYFGGSSSGKSYFLSQRCVINNLRGANYLICRQSATSIRKSCFNEILKAISNMGIMDMYHVNNQEMIITNLHNGKQIMFTGLFDTERLKSISPRNGILEHVWIEEATETTYHGFKQLQKSLRGLFETAKIITLSFNPVLKTSWIYKEFFQDCWDENIIFYKNDMTEPSYAIRYYTYIDLNDSEIIKAEFYDEKNIIEYEGYIGALRQVSEPRLHLFDYCPLQGIPKNNELLGSAEKVTSLIDAYDKIISDSTNEIESFANAYMVFENVNMSDEDMKKAQATGAIKFFNGTGNGKVYFLTKDLNDSFIENKLDRLENNIYRFSKTPILYYL